MWEIRAKIKKILMTTKKYFKIGTKSGKKSLKNIEILTINCIHFWTPS